VLCRRKDRGKSSLSKVQGPRTGTGQLRAHEVWKEHVLSAPEDRRRKALLLWASTEGSWISVRRRDISIDSPDCSRPDAKLKGREKLKQGITDWASPGRPERRSVFPQADPARKRGGWVTRGGKGTHRQANLRGEKCPGRPGGELLHTKSGP